jgi:hypothetical protein
MSYDREAIACHLLEPVRFKKAGRRKKRKVTMTKAEQHALYAEAKANGTLPPVAYCKPGLPTGTANLSDAFVGGWLSSTKGARPLDRWEDTSTEMARRAEFERWCAALPEEEQRALNVAGTAANFREVGEAFGSTGKSSERVGKRRLLAANDHLQEIMDAA